MKAIKIKVYGRVQGVNFRVGVKTFCDKKEIDGYVLNRENGSVFIFAQGSSVSLLELVSWVKESPGFCKVEGIEQESCSVKKEFEGFRIRYERDFISDQVQSFKNLGKSVFYKVL